LHVFRINPILMHRLRQNCFFSIRDRLLVGRFLQRRFAAIVLIDGRVVGLSLLLNVTEKLFRNCKGIRCRLRISAGGSLLRFVLSYSLIDDFLHGLYRDELWSSVWSCSCHFLPGIVGQLSDTDFISSDIVWVIIFYLVCKVYSLLLSSKARFKLGCILFAEVDHFTRPRKR
jgi:hypothetical protein